MPVTLTAKEYLESLGIKQKTTAVISLIDGCLRQPDLILLLENYSQLKLQESVFKNHKIV